MSKNIPPEIVFRNNDTYPASMIQRQFWVLNSYDPYSSAYNLPMLSVVEGDLNIAALNSAINALLRRHRIFRATFDVDDHSGKLVQRFEVWKNRPLSTVDLRPSSGAASESTIIGQAVSEEIRKPFNLAMGPPLRFRLFRTGERTHLFLITVHHIVFDLATKDLFAEELAKEYKASLLGLTATETTEVNDYAAFSLWQEHWLQSGDCKKMEAAWRRCLDSAEPILNLPLKQPQAKQNMSRSGAIVPIRLTSEMFEQIKSFCHKEKVMPFLVLLTAWTLTLARICGQTKLCVGVPRTNRRKDEFKQTMGCFVNILPLAIDISDNPTMHEALHRIRLAMLQMHRMQEMPYYHLVQLMRHTGRASDNSLFQVGFTFEPPMHLKLEGVSVKPKYIHHGGAQLDLFATFWEEDGEMSGVIEYDSNRFDSFTVKSIGQSYLGTIDEICSGAQRKVDTIIIPIYHSHQPIQSINSDPTQSLSEMPIITGDDRHKLLVAWNDTKTDYPMESCIHQLFEEQARLTPKAVAVEFEGCQLTYAELDTRSSHLAEHLQALGVGPDVLVALYINRSLEMMIALLAILKAGGAYLPLDRIFPRDRLAFMLEDANPPVLITLTSLRDEISPHHATVVNVDDFPQRTETHSPANGPTSENLAYVLYTSGSTGKPKGVEISHRALVNFISSMQKEPGINAHDTLLSVTTISFDILGLELWLPLSTGAKVVIVSQEVAMDGRQLANAMTDCNVTMMQATPATWRLLLESGWEGNPGLKILCGGEAWSAELAKSLLSRCVSLWNMYGPTETTIWSAVCQIRDGEPMSLGRPIANTQFYVVNPQLQLLPVGTPGELLIGGDGLARGYRNRPELTAEKFIPNSFSEDKETRLYRTGDTVRYLPDGRLEYIGRLDQQVKIRGFRIELGDIETVLCSKTDVKQSAVVVSENGEEKQLIAYIVPVANEKPTVADLRAYLKQKLPDYMIPAIFVFMTRLPLTPNGKVDRKALPEPEVKRQAPTAAASMGEIQRRIAAIWQEVLPQAEVGLDDNFFDLGGHSLLLVRLAGKLHDTFHADVPVLKLFQFPTVRQQATLFGGKPNEDALRWDKQSTASKAHPASQTNVMAQTQESIAVVGMACRVPGADNVEQFWQNLAGGIESIRQFTDDELDTLGVLPNIYNASNYVKAAPVLDHIDQFDAAFFGYSPREAELIDPQQRLFLELAWHALEHAGYDPFSYRGIIGAFGGTGSNYYGGGRMPGASRDTVAETYQWELGNENDYLITRLAYKLGFTGPSLTIQTACSTSLVATHMACQSLLSGQCDMALAGGVSVNILIKGGYFFQEGLILSPDGHCRAFDAKGQGTVHGQGLGIVILKRLTDALADGDKIHAVILGSAVNNDGAARVGFTAPGVTGQSQVIVAAQAAAGVDPEKISYIEAHGTGTRLGDPIEIKALTTAFRFSTDKRGYCAIGSVKTNIGHLDAAAGVVGLIKTVLMLKHRMIPPSLHFENPNPALELESSPFYVNAQLSRWGSATSQRCAGVSSFGLGGTNAHLIVGEAPPIEPSDPAGGRHLLLFSARTREALDTSIIKMADHLEKNPEINLADVAFTLQTGRRSFPYRGTLVCHDVSDAVEALRCSDSRRITKTVCQTGHRDIVFMFSGQGSQYPNMGLDLYKDEPVFRNEIDHCSEILKHEISADLHQLLYPKQDQLEAAADILNQTAVTQPALFAIEYALARLWIAWGVQPQAFVGHSIGEYTAACLAGVFSLEDALTLVAARGHLMQEMPPGRMLAVFLTEEQLVPFMNDALSLSVVNNPGICVVSGDNDAIENLENVLLEKQIMCRRLHTSHAFHSKMMDPILARFTELVRRVGPKPPMIRFLSNVSGTWITREEAMDPSYWARHLRSTVRFADCLRELFKEPNRVFLEVGPGSTLNMLAEQHPAKESNHVTFSSIRLLKERHSDSDFIYETLGALWRSGTAIDWTAFHGGTKRQRLPLPVYPFDGMRHWIEARRPATLLESQVSSDKQPVESIRPLPDRRKEVELQMSRPETEKILTDIWRDLLGHDSIKPDDDFFTLGGHSLIAIRLFSKIEHIFGRRLPLSALIGAPTVAKLADLLVEDHFTPSWTSLVTIRAEGSRSPFFAVHSEGGNVLEYTKLASYMNYDVPFYGLQSLGLEGNQIVAMSIEEMACRYISEIKTRQPSGPYYIGGYCLGGIVAYEMARQLEAAGDQIGLLAMISATNPEHLQRQLFCISPVRRFLYQMLERIQLERDNLSVLNAREKFSYANDRVWRLGLNLQIIYEDIADALKKMTGFAPYRHSRRYILEQTRWEQDKAFFSYKPSPVKTGITLFRASRQPRGILDDPALGWGNLSKKGIAVFEIRAFHKNILKDPNVKPLAQKLQECLDTTQNFLSKRSKKNYQTHGYSRPTTDNNKNPFTPDCNY